MAKPTCKCKKFGKLSRSDVDLITQAIETIDISDLPQLQRVILQQIKDILRDQWLETDYECYNKYKEWYNNHPNWWRFQRFGNTIFYILIGAGGLAVTHFGSSAYLKYQQAKKINEELKQK